MKIAGKTLKEYLLVSRTFITIIFISMAIISGLRLYDNNLSSIEYPLGILILIIIILAGWLTVRKQGFDLVQVGFLGFLLSFGTHWALPIFHSLWEVLYLILINSLIYAVIAVLGGLLATILKKLQKSSNSELI